MATYGIDLGTTYSCIAYIDDTARPVIAKNATGDDTTPSVVFFESADNVVVGRDAKSSTKISPELVVSLIKREMGRDVTYEFHGAKHTPVTISALILREIARAATEQTHEEVRDVVITVPAYFGVGEREATRTAGKIAGLNVLDVVPEPVAAALHYEAVSAGADRTILVYDLGGGTFDTTVIRMQGNDITVVCTDGDHHLGGADWDDKIAEYLLDCFVTEHPDVDAADSEDFLQELATAAEDMKKALSSVDARRYPMRFAGEVTRAELSRDTFERITADLLERTFDITRRTIDVAREKGVDHFDDVLLVGGATRMPAVAAGLRDRFAFSPKLHDPDLAVAKGAALFALIKSVKIAVPGMGADGAEEGAESGAQAAAEAVDKVADQLGIAPEQVRKLAEKKVTIVVPRAFGVKVLRDVDTDDETSIIDHLLHANDELPAPPTTRRYGTARKNQTRISVGIWEQAGAVESENVEYNEEIGHGEISGMPPLPKGSPIDVTFQMDETGILRVHAVELTNGKDLDIEIKIKGVMSGEDVDDARDAVARYTVGG